LPLGKTGRPVLWGTAGGLFSIHQPFIHALPNSQGGASTPHRFASGSPMKPSRLVNTYGTNKAMRKNTTAHKKALIYYEQINTASEPQ
jgi:hypothetical protein